MTQELPIEINVLLAGRFALDGATMITPVSIAYFSYNAYNCSHEKDGKNLDVIIISAFNIQLSGAIIGVVCFTDTLLTSIETV